MVCASRSQNYHLIHRSIDSANSAIYTPSSKLYVTCMHEIFVTGHLLTHADILNLPRIDYCNQTGHAKFVCRISNYSEYDEVVVVENDRILFNKSTKGLHFGCWPNVPDPSIATCTVNVSTSGKASYKLCVGYNSSVLHKTKLQCSRDIIITSIQSYGKDINLISQCTDIPINCA